MDEKQRKINWGRTIATLRPQRDKFGSPDEGDEGGAGGQGEPAVI